MLNRKEMHVAIYSWGWY